MIEIKYTIGKSYIRITHPDLPERNFGYISPRDGQISVKEVLWQMIIVSGIDNPYQWQKGCGRHGGTNYYLHTVNSNSLKYSISFIEKVLKDNNQPYNNHIK